MLNGNNAPLGSVNLGPMGAPGFQLSDRLDMSGHASGSVLPHVNSEIINPSGSALRGPAFRDLANNQVPGMNGMQNP